MLYLILAALSWSIVGVLVKIASLQFDPFTITFARFAVGAGALAFFLAAVRRKLWPEAANRWIWIGALGKLANYLFENAGVAIGYAYGNVIVPPIQTIVLLLIALLIYKERLPVRRWIAAAIVFAGLTAITLNGRSIGGALAAEGWVTLLFVLSAVGAALHFLSMKKLLDAMNDVSANYSVFLWASLLAALPLPFTAEWEPGFVPGAWLSAAALGLITGVSFIMLSKGLRVVNFTIAVIVTNLASFFTVIWAWLLLGEPITGHIVAGAGAVVFGMVLLNWQGKAVPREEQGT